MNRLRLLSLSLLAGAGLFLGATTASAQGGLNLSWNDCGSAGVEVKSFACDTNAGGPEQLYASIITGVDMPQLNGHASVIELYSSTPALGTWWDFGGCRSAGAISSNFNFTGGPFTCFDPWSGNAAGGLNVQYPYGDPTRERIRTVCAIPGSTSISGTDEYYVFSLAIHHSNSTGTGACTGCSDGVCVMLQSILVTQPAGVGDYIITNPADRSWVAWQPAGLKGPYGCPYIRDPARATTWSSVKSLYR